MSEKSGEFWKWRKGLIFTGKSFQRAKEKRVQIAEYSEMLKMKRFLEFHKDSPRFLFNKA